MRYLIITDLHANWQALEAVIADARGQYDRIVSCGDIVGYGADPNRVAGWVRQNVFATVRGNHDRAVDPGFDLDNFSPLAATATLWTRQALTPENRTWLLTLPAGPLAEANFHLVHGSPADEDEYVASVPELRRAFRSMPNNRVFFGHTHIQCHSSCDNGRLYFHEGPCDVHTVDELDWMINPGAVGQPRDRDPRAAYALFDSATGVVRLRRTEYDIETARRTILEAGLPPRLGDRLFTGN